VSTTATSEVVVAGHVVGVGVGLVAGVANAVDVDDGVV
jgi:hypothetical protein